MILGFAEVFGRMALEQHGTRRTIERLPTEQEVNGILANVDLLSRSLQQVKDVVEASKQSERIQKGANVEGSFQEDQDVPTCWDGLPAHHGGVEEAA